MGKLFAKVVSVHLGTEGNLGKVPAKYLQTELDGFVGDRHRSFSRENWAHDKQAEGVVRRNERHWSAISIEELAQIERDMDLKEPLTAASIGVNICLSGVPSFSRLPKGTIFKFPSGAELMVEEYNPPCKEMGEKLAITYTTNSGKDLIFSDFSKAAKLSRGLIGVVEVAGRINVGDDVKIMPYIQPRWLT